MVPATSALPERAEAQTPNTHKHRTTNIKHIQKINNK
jgi:hypothetical protein